MPEKINDADVFEAFDCLTRPGQTWFVSAAKKEAYRKIVFTYGHCHSLALALHQATRWDMMGCNWYRQDGHLVPDHVFVLTPQGRALDIYGLSGVGSHPDASFGPDWRRVTVEQMEKLIALDFYEPFDLPLARQHIDPLLQLVQPVDAQIFACD